MKIHQPPTREILWNFECDCTTCCYWHSAFNKRCRILGIDLDHYPSTTWEPETIEQMEQVAYEGTISGMLTPTN